MSNWLVPNARMLNRYVSSSLLGVIDLYLMLGSLLGICLVIYYVCLTCFFDFYIMLGSLPDMCLVNVEVFFYLYLVLESLPGVYGWFAEQ